MTTVIPRTSAAPVQAMPPPTPKAPVAIAPAAPEAIEAAKVDEKLTPKYVEMARKEKAQYQKDLALKAREEALKAKEAEYISNYIPKDRIKSDFLSVMSEAGLTADEIVNAISNQDPNSLALKKITDKLAALETSQKTAAEQQAAQQAKAYEQAVTQVRNEVKILVDSDATYEAIKANEAQEAVVELITDTFNKEGTLLTVEEAATQVENYLLEQAVKFASLDKVKQRLAPKVEEPVKGLATKQAKTLTHANTTAQTKSLSSKERRERAMAAFRGEQLA